MKQAHGDVIHLAAIEPTPADREVPALDILSQITASLAAENDLEALLERFLVTMVQLAGASAGAVRVVSADGKQLRLVGAIGLSAEVLAREQHVEVTCGICGTAVRECSVHQTTDLRICAQRVGSDHFGQRYQAVVAVPVRYKGNVLGIYNLFLTDTQNIPKEVSLLLRSIGELLGLALENARLTQENLRITVMNERQMLANEVHDSLAQMLSYMRMRMTLLQEAMLEHDQSRSFKYLADVNQTLGSAYASLRELLTHFRSRMDPHGLLHALQAKADGFHDQTGIALDFVNNVPDMNLPVDQEVQVFHIVQEALANVGRHSGAKRARLMLNKQDGRFEIIIEDDGIGITDDAEMRGGPLRDSPQDVHFGLNIMRERAQHLGGEITVENLPERGTRVRLCFPASHSAARHAHE